MSSSLRPIDWNNLLNSLAMGVHASTGMDAAAFVERKMELRSARKSPDFVDFQAAMASDRSDEAVARFCVQKADPALFTAPDRSHPFLLAAMHNKGTLGVLRGLLPLFDAKTVVKPHGGETALTHAAIVGNVQAIELLLPVSDPEARDQQGATAFLRAAQSARLASLRALLPFCDPRAKDPEGATALTFAACCDRSDIVEFLLPHSDVAAKTIHGFDAFEACVDNLSWHCADAFAGFISPQRARDALEEAPAGELPALAAFVARHERAILSQELAVVEQNIAEQAASKARSEAGSARQGSDATTRARAHAIPAAARRL